MAGSVNKVILIGNLGKDPEVRNLQNGGKVCTLRIATSETWKDRGTGERQERTQWHSVVIFNENLVGVAERFLKKGSKVYVEGQLETRKWQDQQGQERYTTEIVMRQFRGELTLLDSPAGNGGNAGDYREEQAGQGAGGGYRGRADGTRGGGGAPKPQGTYGDLDDEIPFGHADHDGAFCRLGKNRFVC